MAVLRTDGEGDLEVSSADGLECQVYKAFRSACFGDADYDYEDKRYCILHLPSENKKADFKKALYEKLGNQDFNFAGAFFPSGTTQFEQHEFVRADFSGATFCGETSFFGAQFSGDKTSFQGATFSSRYTSFLGARFGVSGGGAYFGGAQFSGDSTNFDRAEFSGHTDFMGAKFSAVETTFRHATFSGGKANFIGARFSGNSTDFSEAEFSGYGLAPVPRTLEH